MFGLSAVAVVLAACPKHKPGKRKVVPSTDAKVIRVLIKFLRRKDDFLWIVSGPSLNAGYMVVHR
jgi:hypothetical protein